MLLDNFGFGGGLNGTPNIQGVTKFDSIFSIIFFISVFMYFVAMKKNSYSPNEFRMLLLFVLLASQIRPTGIILFILILSLVLKHKVGVKKIFFHNFLLFGVYLSWVIKNIISTGCIYFPLAISCLDSLKWSSKEGAVSVSNNSKSYFLNSSYEQELSMQVLQNVFFSLSIIFLIILFLKIKQKTKVNFDILFIVFSLVNIYLFLKYYSKLKVFWWFLPLINSRFVLFTFK